MGSISKQSLIRELLANLSHGQPFGLTELAAHQVSPYLASRYAKSGWLERLGHGVYGYPNDTLQQDACLLFLQRQVPGFHVGGKTALSWQGIRHNVSSRAKLQLWGDHRFTLPVWFTARFPARYFHRSLFDHEKLAHKLADAGMDSLANHTEGLLVSCRERAILEVLNEVGVTQDLEEATQLFETFSSFRFEIIGALLAACSSIKTVRLFLQLAERTRVLDIAALRNQYPILVGSDARWSRRLQDGTLLTLKKPC